MKSVRFVLACVLLLAVSAVPCVRAQLIPITWLGTADWTSAANWSLTLVPTTSNNALISSGTVTVSTSPSVGAITLSGGSITGTGTLTLTSTGSVWSGGDMNGAGTLAIQSGASLSITTNTHDFNSRTISNSGTVTWTGGALRTGNGGNIANSGTFTDTASNSIVANLGGAAGNFANSGTYNKNAAATTTMSLPFVNTGILNVNSGTFAINNGGSNAAGAKINVANGTGLNFSGGNFNVANSADIVDSGGSYTVSGGNLTITSGSLTLPSVAISNGNLTMSSGNLTATSLTVTGGTLAGPGGYTTPALSLSNGSITTTGNVTLTAGNSTWNSGNMNGAGTLNVQNGAILSITTTNVHDFNARAIVNDGLIAWSGGSLRTGSGAGITNNTTFTDTASGSIVANLGGAAGNFNNVGTYNKSAAGNTTMSLPFVNTGILNVNAGTFFIDNGGSNAAGAKINVASGTGLNFSGGTFTLANSADIVDSGGSYTVSGGNLTITSGSLTLPSVAISNGNLTMSSGNLTATSLTVSGGTLAGPGGYTTPALTLSNGSITTTGNVTLTAGNSTWNSGNMNGAATLNIQSGAILSVATTNVHDFNARAIVNNGLIAWSGGSLRTGNGAGITNNATFTDTASGSIIANLGGAAGNFNNAGTYNKSAAGNTTLSLPFVNTGILNVNAGTFFIDNGGSNAAGAKINVASGTGLNFSGGNFTVANSADIVDSGGSYAVSGGNLTISSGSLTIPSLAVSAGNISLSSGNLTASSITISGGTLAGPGSYTTPALSLSNGSITTTGNLTLTAGNSTWSSGNMNGAGTLNIQSGAILSVTTTNVHDFNARAIVNNGLIAWSGGQLRTGSNGSITNNSTFTDTASSSIVANLGGAAGNFNNVGTYNKNAAGNTTMSLPFVNTGILNVNAGTFFIDNGGSNAAGAKINVGSGTGLNFSGGNFAVANSADIVDSGGSYAVSGGNLTISSGSLTIPSLAVSAGNISLSSGNLTASSITVSGGTLAGPGSYTTPALSLSNGSITTTGNLTLTAGNSTWSSGNMNGAGTLNIQSGAILSVTTTNVHDFNSRAIVNNGSIVWSDGQLRTGTNGSITNNGTFTDTASDFVVGNLGGTAGNFNNGGTYNKNGVGTTPMALPFVNTGILNLNAGIFNINGGGSNAAGAKINVASGTGLNFSGGNFTVANSADIVDSGGSYTVSGGNLTISSGSLTIPTLSVSAGTISLSSGNLTATSLTVSGGTLAGPGSYTTPLLNQSNGSITTTGSLTLTGPSSTWTAGNMNGAGTLNIQSGATFTISSTNVHDFDSRAIVNNGTVNWTGGQLRTGHGGSFTNNNTFTDTAADQINNAYGGTAGTFNNAGTYTKNSTGTTTMDLVFTNTGMVNLNSGIFAIDAGGTNAAGATINIASAADLRLSSGTFTVASGADIVASNSTVSITGGVLSLTAGTLTPATLNISGGNLTGAGNVTVATLNQTNGSISGTGTVNLTGPSSTWTAGNMNGAGTLNIQNGATFTLSSTNVHDFDSHTIVNNGTVNWTSGQFRTGHGGSFTNNNTFTDTASDFFNNAYGGTLGTFNNIGTYAKNGAGTTTMDLAFTNTGIVNVNSGIFNLSESGTNAAGAKINVASGADLRISGGTYTVASGADIVVPTGTVSITNGSLSLTAGTVTTATLNISGGNLSGAGNVTAATLNQTNGSINGTGTLTLTGPSSTWTAGNMNGTGTLNIQNGATLTLSTTNVHDFDSHTIVNDGTVNWTSGQFRTGHGGSFTNNNTFTDTASDFFNNAYGGTVGTFNNVGTYNKNGSGTTTMDLGFTNTGIVNVNSGIFAIDGGGTNNSGAKINVASGADLRFSGGTYTVASGADIVASNATVSITGGTLSPTAGTLATSALNISAGNLSGTGNVTAVTLNQTNGSINGAGTLTVTGPSSTWTAGNMNGSGTLNIQSGATLALITTNVHDFDSHAIVNNGTVNWTGGQLRTGHDGSFTNNGTFTDTASDFITNAYGGTVGAFNNAGTYTKSASGTTTMDLALTNTGIVNVSSGTLKVNGGGSSAGTINLSPSTTIDFSNGNFTFPANSAITGNGLVVISGSNATFTGNNISSANISVSGGTATFNGNTTAGNVTLSNGTLNGSGTIAVGLNLTLSGTTLTGNGTLNANGGTLINNSFSINGNRTLNLGGNSTWSSGHIFGGTGAVITVKPGVVFTVASDFGLFGTNYGGTTLVFNNQGTFNKTAGTGQTDMSAVFNNTGTLDLDSGTLILHQGGTMSAGGAVDVAAGATLNFASNYTVMDGVQFTGLGMFIQTAGTLTLDGQLKAPNFTWSGGNWNAANNSGLTTTIAAGTTLTMTGDNDGVRDFNGRTIANNGLINWTGGHIRGGNGSSFINNTTFNDQNTLGYSITNAFGGTDTFINNGTYNRTTTGTTTVTIPFTNNGAINVSAGTLHFTSAGTFTTNTGGTLTTGTGAALQFDLGLTLPAGGTLGGSGGVIGNVTASGIVSPGASAGKLTITGSLTLLSTASLLIELGGPVQGTGYDFLSISGSGTLGGTLGVSFLNGYQNTTTSSDNFTVVTASSALTGAFTNVANGQRLFTTDGFGSFQVNYGVSSAFATNSVVLSNFAPVPEPSTWALLLVGAGALTAASRRRRK